MKFELKEYQTKAVNELLMSAEISQLSYEKTGKPQIISFTAPTGAGKTIMLAAFVEKIYEEHPKAIFIWLSDSPELNKQSLDKFYFNADGINRSQLLMIETENFNRRILDDGQIYFLNTQKLSKTSNLTRHLDIRQYTIWETLQSTIKEKSSQLYLIIDEAHRGMKTKRATATATTIMQKFIKGSDEDGLSPAPLIIGVSATPARFNELVKGAFLSTHHVVVTADEVQKSGLLKERIVAVFPKTDEEKAKNIISRDMSMLDAAADEWKNKCEHWAQYCREQHKKIFNPIFVVQVLNGTGKKISDTDLDECLRRISARTGYKFEVGEVVHTFGQTESDLTINNLRVVYEEPSRISGSDKIKIVFFKENLSTGWDCPQAETMMSFRHASDSTYIAQILGRMIRTPMQSRIAVDETLNEVRLYLPNFDEATVKNVVDDLRKSEGEVIATEIISESVGEKKFDVLTVKVERPVEQLPPKVIQPAREDFHSDEANKSAVDSQKIFEENFLASSEKILPAAEKISPELDEVPTKKIIPAQVVPSEPATGKFFNREEIVRAINQMGLLTYTVRSVQINDYLKSLLKLAHFLVRSGVNLDAFDDVSKKILQLIHGYIEGLKISGKYDALKKEVKQFRLSEQTFEVFGKTVESGVSQNLFVTTDADIERQFSQAELKLKGEGIANAYVQKFCANDYEKTDDYRIDVILFVANVDCLNRLEKFAQKIFYGLIDEYRLKMAKFPDKLKKEEYEKIVADSDTVSKHNFTLPETVTIPHDGGGKVYGDHLFADKLTGKARIKLNGWEEGVLHEEQRQNDFVCWLRNSPRASWAMCIPYKSEDNETHLLYPDFLIVRLVEGEYIVDILEPHDSGRRDNFGKARGLAEYAKENNGVGRIQLIREVSKAGQKYFSRLDISKAEVRNKILHSASNNELDKIFDEHGNHI